MTKKEELIKHYEARIEILKELKLTGLLKKWENELRDIKIRMKDDDKN